MSAGESGCFALALASDELGGVLQAIRQQPLALPTDSALTTVALGTQLHAEELRKQARRGNARATHPSCEQLGLGVHRAARSGVSETRDVGMTQRLGHTRRGFLTLGKRYDLLEKIGLGGMGAVWRAHDTRLNREVAVKAACIQIPEGSTFARQMERCRLGLEKEVAVLSELTHPALPELYDSTGLSFATPFIAMELIAGQGLDTLRRLPPRNAVSTLLPVANALALMHDHGFIHRDVKPANILVKRAWQTVLIDFGLVSIGEPVSDEVFGTPSYIAPEYLTGQGLDARCDVWALGVTLYETLTGGVVFYEDERQWVAPPLAVVGDFDWPLSRVVGRAIERDPEERWPTMRAFEDALRAWLRAQP